MNQSIIKILIQVIIILLLTSCSIEKKRSIKQDLVNSFDLLVEQQRYFKLRDHFELKHQKLSTEDQMYYQAIIHNVFNQAERSNEVIDHLLKITTHLKDHKINNIYKTKLLNHINLYQYSAAAQCSEFILNNFRTYNDDDEIESLENEINIWRTLADTPAQEVNIAKDTTIAMFRDQLDLLNVDVQFTNSNKPFIFDTGANFSVVTQSVANELGLKQLPADFFITAATGNKVNSSLAIAEDLSLQGIHFKNVVFLVLADKDLSFPQVDYYPNGALGYPLIEALKEIRINKNDSIFVPYQPVAYPHSNLALDGLMPIAAVHYKNDLLSFTLDTGARKTTLYPQFYLDYQNQIESSYQKKTFQSSGAGGSISYEGYLIDSYKISIADSEHELKNTTIHINNIGGKKSHFHGNLGQDFIKHFDQMILSFKQASLIFK